MRQDSALLAALAWLGRVRRGGGVSPAAAALFAAALMAKPMPVTLPVLLLLLDWWPLGRWAPAAGIRRLLPPPQLWLEKAPLLLLAGISAAITLVVQDRGGAMAELTAIPPALRVSNALVSCARYLGMTFWPAGLSVFHPYPDSIPRWQWAGALVLLAAISTVALRTAAHRPWLAVGWFWFLGALAPVIGLVQVGDQSLAERYTYLPLVGIFVAAGWAAADSGAVAAAAAHGGPHPGRAGRRRRRARLSSPGSGPATGGTARLSIARPCASIRATGWP